MLADKLLINLKILSKLQKNGKLTRSQNGIISLDTTNFIQPLRRFVSNNSRKQSVFEISSIINEAIETFDIILNSKYMNKNHYLTEEYILACQNLELLLLEFSESKQGIENLKFTYQNDFNITSQNDYYYKKYYF